MSFLTQAFCGVLLPPQQVIKLVKVWQMVPLNLTPSQSGVTIQNPQHSITVLKFGLSDRVSKQDTEIFLNPDPLYFQAYEMLKIPRNATQVPFIRTIVLQKSDSYCDV